MIIARSMIVAAGLALAFLTVKWLSCNVEYKELISLTMFTLPANRPGESVSIAITDVAERNNSRLIF
jgi:hypothetical protein